MEKEVLGLKTYKIDQEIISLNFLTPIIELFNTHIYGDLEIDPFNEFTIEFQSNYWYLQYYLLKDKKVYVDDSLQSFFKEENINIIWFQITDEDTFKIKCIDGTWFIEILKLDIQFDNVISSFNLKEIS